MQHQKDALNATFYIIFDGLDEEETEQGKPFSGLVDQVLRNADEHAQLKIRIFIAGRASGLDPLQHGMDSNLLEIDLAASSQVGRSLPNEDDILLFAEDRLSKLSAFDEPLTADMAELKKKIKLTLARGVRG